MTNPKHPLHAHLDFSQEVSRADPWLLRDSRPKVWLLWMILILRSFLFSLELVVGFQSQSLSLLAGSGHLFMDLVTMGLTLLAAWLFQHHSDGSAIHYSTMTAWVGLLNGISLSALALLIAWESINHLQAPESISSLPVLLVAGLNLVINGIIIRLLNSRRSRDLMFRGVFLHGVADAASSLSILLAALAVYFYNWFWADAVAGLIVAVLIGWNVMLLARASWKIIHNGKNLSDVEN